jgi:hypothetical protein
MSSRRQFITFLGGAAAWPLTARAQQPAKMLRLGVLLYSTPQADPQMEQIRIDLRELSYVEGQNLVVSYRSDLPSAYRSSENEDGSHSQRRGLCSPRWTRTLSVRWISWERPVFSPPSRRRASTYPLSFLCGQS